MNAVATDLQSGEMMVFERGNAGQAVRARWIMDPYNVILEAGCAGSRKEGAV